MTLTQIIAYVNRKYPNQETDANKVLDLDMIHKDVFMKIRKLSNDYVIYQDATVADQSFYNLPTGCRVEDIVRLDVETGVDTEIYDTFEYAGIKDTITDRKVYLRAEEGTYAMFDNEDPIAVTGKNIMMYYYPRPTTLLSSTMSQVPDLDTDYHSVLCYLLIVEMANLGHNPDTEIADYWQKKADEMMNQIVLSLAERQAAARTKTNECDEIW